MERSQIRDVHRRKQRSRASNNHANSLTKNPQFEVWIDGQIAHYWGMYESGYVLSSEGGLEGSQAVNVTLDNVGKVGGAVQRIFLEQNEPSPVVLQGWSQPLGIKGAGDEGDYSLYADVTFRDGTHHWGFKVPFDPSR